MGECLDLLLLLFFGLRRGRMRRILPLSLFTPRRLGRLCIHRNAHYGVEELLEVIEGEVEGSHIRR